ncbi:unnamed protein product [Gongylonema pulchrum]|uniref:RNA-dependent RNA polymerase n=1 Tax=Gongylonema pulchrum TaxID=637853 RepID=A0A183D9I1_9BILA|nr:unnamed protein product [Gongylonema pulchrum]
MFVNYVLDGYERDPRVTLEVLERLINMVDEMKELPPLEQCFKRLCDNIYEKRELLAAIYDKDFEEGFQKVRKVVITPTRTLLVVPELLMGNRVLREFDDNGEGALRIQFREDDGTPLRRNIAGLFVITTTVHNSLLHGIHISG